MSLFKCEDCDFGRVQFLREQIKALQEEQKSTRWLLEQCEQMLTENNIAYVELRAFLQGRPSTKELLELANVEDM